MYPLENYSLRLSVVQIWYQCNALPGVVQPSRPSNGFMYYTKGEGQDFYFGDKVYHAGFGDFFYLPYGASYSNRKLSPDTEYYEIDFRLFDENDNPCALLETPYVVQRHEAGRYFQLIKEMYDVFSDVDPLRSFLYYGNICRIADLLRTAVNTSEREICGLNRILRSVTHLREHFDEDTTLEELAKLSSVSVSSLEKIFKKCYGLSPIQYRNLLRIDHAKSLLLNGHSIGETAGMVGFSNYFYFCKFFKSKTGTSPSEYVRLNRGT